MSTLNADQNSGQQAFNEPLRLIYGAEAEQVQFGNLYLPGSTGAHPTVILIHGGFWRAPFGYPLMTALAEDLVTRGIAAWNIEYRRIGDEDGGWPATLLDVAHAADYLRELAPTYNLDLKRVVSVGHSAGGHLALWLAARPRIAKDSPLWRLKLGSGAVAELLGGSPGEVPERYAAGEAAALLPLGVPQVLVHGTEDDRVPLQVSQSYAAAAIAAGDSVKLVELAGVDHFALINPYSEAWTITVEALQELLR